MYTEQILDVPVPLLIVRLLILDTNPLIFPSRTIWQETGSRNPQHGDNTNQFFDPLAEVLPKSQQVGEDLHDKSSTV